MTDPNQENYNIDEMLQRLKSRNHESGEEESQLVTRDDGTQVMRVKKRKRRSKQPHKEAEKKRRKRTLMVVALGGGSVLIVGLTLLVWLLMINGESYQAEVENRIEAWTGAEVEMRSFRGTPVSAGMDYIQATWPESSPVASLRLHGVQTDLMATSHLTGVWRGEQLTAKAGELILRDVASSEPGDWMLPDGDLPFRMPMRVSRLRVKFGDGKRSAMVLSDATASFLVPDSNLLEASMIFEGGKSKIGRWGRFNLKLASFGLSPSGLQLSRLRLSPEAYPQAEIQLNGDGYPVVPVRGSAGEFGFSVRSMPTELLLGSNLGSMIDGTFDSVKTNLGVFTMDPTSFDSMKFEDTLRSAEAHLLELKRFAFLQTLSRELSLKRMDAPQMNPGGRIKVTRGATRTELTNLDLHAEGILRVRGEVIEDSGQLSGVLRVGLAESVIAASPSRSVPQLFSRGEDGYFWAKVTLSGSTRTPQDDMQAQLKSATSKRSPVTEGSNDLDDEFIDLTTPQE